MIFDLKYQENIKSVDRQMIDTGPRPRRDRWPQIVARKVTVQACRINVEYDAEFEIYLYQGRNSLNKKVLDA